MDDIKLNLGELTMEMIKLKPKQSGTLFLFLLLFHYFALSIRFHPSPRLTEGLFSLV